MHQTLKETQDNAATCGSRLELSPEALKSRANGAAAAFVPDRKASADVNSCPRSDELAAGSDDGREVPSGAPATRERIIDAAKETFARSGYDGAQVLEICTKARVTPSQIKFFFEDKKGLYTAILNDLMENGNRNYPIQMDLDPDAPAESRLLAFVRSLLHREYGYKGWGGNEAERLLVAREIARPTYDFSTLVIESGKPLVEELFSILRELLTSAAEAETVRYFALSVLSQCMVPVQAGPVLRNLGMGLAVTYEDVESLAQHITEVILAGTQKMTDKYNNW